MKCKIISISHKPSDWEKKAIQFYSKQLPNHFQFSSIEVKPSSQKSMSRETILQSEGAEILKHIDDDAFIVLWDRQGKRISSLSFAKLIQDQADAGNNLNFIIGGAYGAASEVSQKSDLILSASDLTLPHRLFKIFLVEQIYRASAINRNHPYHK